MEKINLVVKTKKKIKKLGLALGGGGARGLSLIGVIRAFEENNITFDYVAGTSVGALIGAFYCAGLSSKQMEEIARNTKESDIKTNLIPFMPSKTEGLERIIKTNIGDIDILDLKTPFCAVAVDVLKGEEVHLTKGNLAKAVAGSCAVPAVFNPVEFGDYLLFDGGLQNTIPSNVPKLQGCERTIAVDINSSRGSGAKSTKYVDLMMASIGIMMKSNAIKGYLNADLMIAPDLKRFSSKKFAGIDEMIEEGYKSAMEVMPELLELIKKKNKKSFIKRIFRIKSKAK